MKQYCRYCVWLVTGNGTYCMEHEELVSDSKAKHTNNCKDFSFCEIDAYGETNGYKPRSPKVFKAQDGEQIKMVTE